MGKGKQGPAGSFLQLSEWSWTCELITLDLFPPLYHDGAKWPLMAVQLLVWGSRYVSLCGGMHYEYWVWEQILFFVTIETRVSHRTEPDKSQCMCQKGAQISTGLPKHPRPFSSSAKENSAHLLPGWGPGHRKAPDIMISVGVTDPHSANTAPYCRYCWSSCQRQPSLCTVSIPFDLLLP